MTDEFAAAWQRHRAARTVASQARAAQDLVELLGMLGLTAAEGRDPPAEPRVPAPRGPAPRLDAPSASRLATMLRPG
jgi:hypothetical protein